MASSENELLFRLFRDHEDLQGESRTTLISLRAIVTAIGQLECEKEEIKGQVLAFLDTIRKSEPKIVPLINLTAETEEEAERTAVFEGRSVGETKAALAALFENRIATYLETTDQVIARGAALVRDGDFVVVHSASSIVRGSLVEAKRLGRRFEVLVLKQDFAKTKIVLRDLDTAGIRYTLIPEHNLIHFVGKVTKLFLGTLSIASDGKFICAVGTSSIVALTHLHQVPVYLLADSFKFSYRECDERRIHKKWLTQVDEGNVYPFLQYSHDIVELEFVDHLITEKGEIPKEDVVTPPLAGIEQANDQSKPMT